MLVSHDQRDHKVKCAGGAERPEALRLNPMTKIAELSSLFHALSSDDMPRARAVAETIAEQEEKTGHHGAAARLRGALSSTGPRPDKSATALANSSVTHAAQLDLLTPVQPQRLDAVHLAASARKHVLELLKEHKHRERLQLHGLNPRARLLFYGPPGCGKTITARAIAGELGLPIFVVRFDALVGSYLGQTGLRLRELFRFAETNPCVLLVDEIDAIGRRRGRSTDVGELDRIVISLMQQIDLVHPAGVFIGASNLPAELDPALFRRFDMTLEFRTPSQKSLQEYGMRMASERRLRLSPGVRAAVARSASFADAERIIEAEHRRSVLQGL